MGHRSQPANLVTGLIVVLAVLTITSVWAVGPASAASDPAAVRAVLNGKPIALGDVALYHCHDRAYPVIRCFLTPADRDADEVRTTTGAPESGAALGLTADPYVRWYRDAGAVSGPSFVAYFTYSNLGDIGWNDVISSFSTYPGGHPRWWQDAGLRGTYWDWGAASISYVGDAANDKFSSVERL